MSIDHKCSAAPSSDSSDSEARLNMPIVALKYRRNPGVYVAMSFSGVFGHAKERTQFAPSQL